MKIWAPPPGSKGRERAEAGTPSTRELVAESLTRASRSGIADTRRIYDSVYRSEVCGDEGAVPVTYRMFSEHVKELENLGLASRRVRSNGTYGTESRTELLCSPRDLEEHLLGDASGA